MNNVFITFLSLSLSGSLLILILLFCKPFIKSKLSRQWQYYVWIIVIARLLLPIAPIGNLMDKPFEAIARQYYSGGMQSAQLNPTDYDTEFSVSGGAVDDITKNSVSTENIPSRHSIQEALWLLVENNWLVWLAVAAIMLIRKITIYRDFVQYVKAGMQPVSNIELLDRVAVIGEQCNVNRAIELCVNPLVTSPLLIGFFRPCIVIPSANLSDRDFHYTILHELTHYRRRDMFYKWLVQITICLHWFNPLVYLMGREINRSCEFSCDEALITKLGSGNAQDYGYTLLETMASVGQYKEALASVSLSENKKLLKERLEAIMNFRIRSKLAVIFSITLTVALLCGATFTGAYAATANVVSPHAHQEGTRENPATFDMTDPDEKGTTVINLNSNGQKSLIHSSSFKASAGQVLTLEIKSTISGTVDLFLFSPSNKEQRITISGNDDIKSIILSEGTWTYNCTGFFDSGNISIVGTVSGDKKTFGTKDNPATPDMTDPDEKGTAVINLNSNGQKSIIHSSSFKASTGQVLTLEIKSTISGTVDLFLFSPSYKEQRITLGGNNETKTINLSEGTWAYNCTGFFDSGNISIVGTIK